MRVAILELIQTGSGEIRLQSAGADEPLLELRFSPQLTALLGADALTLAQSMLESASDLFEFVQEQQAGTPWAGLAATSPGVAEGSKAEGLKAEETADAEPQSTETVIRLQTSPLH